MPTDKRTQTPRPTQEKQTTVKELLDQHPLRRRALSARALAWLAEGADGRRGEQLAIVVNESGKLQLKPRTESPDNAIVVDVYTKARKKQQRREWKVTIPMDWDAMFLGESAVEKFVFPYYEAQRLLTATELMDLKAAFYGRQDVVGVAHKPPSRPLLLVNKGGHLEPEEFPVGACLEIEIEDPEPTQES